MIRGICVYVVGNNSGTVGKPVTQLLAAMSAYNSKTHASQKWVAVFRAEKYVNPGRKITSGQLKEQVFDKFCLGFC